MNYERTERTADADWCISQVECDLDAQDSHRTAVVVDYKPQNILGRDTQPFRYSSKLTVSIVALLTAAATMSPALHVYKCEMRIQV